jgi:hypothetical protein
VRDYKEPDEPIMYFNLFNNMWGTNFPQWIGGDLCYRYVLFGYNKEQEPYNLEKAAMLKEGVELTGSCLEKEFGEFPEHMQLISARKENDNFIVRFKDLLGEDVWRKFHVKGYSITPVDLNNTVNGIISLNDHAFHVKPYGIYSFLLSKKDIK